MHTHLKTKCNIEEGGFEKVNYQAEIYYMTLDYF